MRTLRPIRTSVAVCAATGLALAAAPVAAAHVSVSASSQNAGSYTVLTFGVPHGCDGSPTTSFAIQIPAEIDAVTPTRNPLYTLDKVMETLDPPVVDNHGNELTERVAQVVYTAVEPLPDGQRDAVELSLRLPEDTAGSTLYFPVVQTCEVGEYAWVQIPVSEDDDLDEPAPAVEVAAASASGGGDDDGDAADAADADPALAAGGDDGSGGQGLAVTALVVGVLGLLAGSAALLRGRK